MDLWSRYEQYRENFYESLNYEFEHGQMTEEEYDNKLSEILSYDDFVGDIIDRAYDDLVDDENSLI